jgi:hypothetical protein
MMLGCWASSTTPIRLSVANQKAITGPNRPPTSCVPKRWIANSPISTATVIGRTAELKLGDTTSSPWTAERTEIAGVIAPSP